MRAVLVWGLAAVMALIAALLAARGPVAERPRAADQTASNVDPRLARCRQLGEAAGRDAACQAAWRAARTRFFGGTAP